MGSLGRQPNRWLTGLVAAVLGVLLSVAGLAPAGLSRGPRRPHRLLRVVIEAAATRPSGLAGIVSLAGERTIENYRDILPDARKVISPALYVGAKEDFAAQGERQQRQLHDAMRRKPNLLQRDGLAHGMDLIKPDGPDGKAVNRRILDFVEQELTS